MRISYFLYAALFILIVVCTNICAHAEIANQIVAEVNGRPITSMELGKMLAPVYRQYVKTYSGEELERMMVNAQEEALQDLIEHYLILDEAKRLELTLDRGTIQTRINEIKKKFENEDTFNAYLKQERMTLDEFKTKVEENLMVQILELREVKKNIEIAPNEVQKYYQEHTDAFTNKTQYHILHILIRKDPADPEKPLQRINEIYRLLKEGESFEALAKQFSQGPNKTEGGDLGFITQGQLMKEIDEQLPSLIINTPSTIIQSKIGYHIVLLKAIKKEAVLSLQDAYNTIEDTLFKQKYVALKQAWISKLKKKAFISIKPKATI